MPTVASIAIHPTQFPAAVRRDLLESLRARRISPKFHYDSLKQTQKWLALHQAYSPSRTDANCAAIYDHAFTSAAERISASAVHLVGLGCGGGQKDTRLLAQLKERNKRLAYTPCDVSTAMVLGARETALRIVEQQNCFPLVCDLAGADDLPAVLDEYITPDTVRVVTFFGMIPNFEPQVILPRLAGLLRADDVLLFSANLAPGLDYEAGAQRILPQYDNPPTRDWLMTFLLDLGFERTDGELRFVVEDCPAGTGLKRVAAHLLFSMRREIQLDDERFLFHPGDVIRLFYSYRYTPARARDLLARHGIQVAGQWIAAGSGEEGVFLCRRA